MVDVLFLSEAFTYTAVKHFIPISGDEEYAMDNCEMTALLIKSFMCASGTRVVITLFRTR